MRKITLFLSALFLALLGAKAETAEIAGGTVTYSGATATTVDGDLVLTFSNPEGTGTISFTGSAQARVLAVGGGGAGGSIGPDENDPRGVLLTGAAGGGGAGGYSDRKIVLSEGSYTVTVGAGGKAAQTMAASWLGGDGGASELRRNNEIVFSVVGGGGGGASKIGGSGQVGGSGGGGSWYGAALAAGSGVEGLGYAGGTPTSAAVGGGGGGAGSRGGADGMPGRFVTSNITGADVSYAAGGRGGNRVDSTYLPTTAALPGNGGDGAASGKGANGANGVVIVRISRLFTYTMVPEPEFVRSVYFTNNTHYVAFDLSAQTAEFQAAVDSITGETSTDTAITDGGAYTNGFGRHSFTLTLKDGYLWQFADGSTSDSAYTAYWRVVEEGTIGLASVDIKKSVSWHEGSTATIAIEAHVVPETKKGIPEVLFLSGRCAAHGYSPAIAKTAIDAVTEVGNIDYYFFNMTITLSDINPAQQGRLLKGEKFDQSSLGSMKNGNHALLYGFYETLWNDVVSQNKQYDYIIFSFDRTRAATQLPGIHPHEREVAEYLRQYYRNSAVIWLVDHHDYNCDDLNITQTPWFPSMLVCNSNTSSGATMGWTTIAGYNDCVNVRSTGTYMSEYASLNAMMGLFCPTKYPVPTTLYHAVTQGGTANDPRVIAGDEDTWRNIMVSAGDAIAYQTLYDNAKNVADMIKKAVVPKSFSADISDNVCVNMGLDIQGASGSWTTNEALTGWTDLKPDGEETILAEAEAKTSVNWSFGTFNVSASVRTGPQTGTTVINGYYQPSLEVQESSSPTVVFTGAPGYVLTYLEIDGEEITDFSPTISSWTFPHIQANHSVVVGYEKVDMKLIRAKQRYPWNNLIDLDYFIGGADLEKTGPMYGRLIFFVEYEDPTDPTKRLTKQLKTFRDNSKLFFNGPSADRKNFSWPESGYVIDINDSDHIDLRTPGYHRVTWDSNADGVAVFQKKKVNFTLHAVQRSIK